MRQIQLLLIGDRGIQITHALMHYAIESILGLMAMKHINAKRVEHGLLLESGRPLAQDLLLLLSLVSPQMICKMAVAY